MSTEVGPASEPLSPGAERGGSDRPERPGGRAWTFTAVLTFAVLLGLAVYSDAGALVDALASFDLVYVPVVLGLTLVAYALRFAKWELYLRVLGARLGWATSATVFFSGLMMSLTPGKVGEVWKAWLTEQAGGGEVARVIPAVAAERVTDLAALAGLALLGLGAYGASRWVLFAVLGLFVVFVLALRVREFWLAVLERVDEWPVVGGFARELETVYEGSFELFALGPLSGALVLSVAAWGLEGVALWAALAGFGIDIGWLVPIAAFGAGSLLGALSMLPGGLGAAEASMVGLLVTAGVTRASAVGATLVVRAGTLWFGALLGGLVFLLFYGSFVDPD